MGACCAADEPEIFQDLDVGNLGGRSSRKPSCSSSESLMARTLSEIDPGVSARHSAYLDMATDRLRKQIDFAEDGLEMNERVQCTGSAGLIAGPPRKLSNRKSDRMLSSLEEVEADIRYRFTFAVFGSLALDVVIATCDSPTAGQLAVPGSAERELAPSSPRQSQRASGVGCASHRCLCRVTDPRLMKTFGPVLAKLRFVPSGNDGDILRCNTYNEALNTVVVFIACLDFSGGAMQSEDQLRGITEALRRERENTRPRLRPIKAVILIGGEPEPPTIQASAPSLDDFLQEAKEASGELWKFGPVDLKARDDLHAIFSDIASARIIKNQTSGRSSFHEEPCQEELEQEAQETAELIERKSVMPWSSE